MAGGRERWAAGLVAAAAWAGLLVQASATAAALGSPLQTVWVLAGYFTILSNLLVAIVFTRVAFAGTAGISPRLLAGTTLSIMLVGAVYALLLHGTTALLGAAAVANVITHMVTPLLVPAFWLVFAPKGGLRGTDTVLWSLYPTLYLVYALVRGGISGHYAYPFIDVVKLGSAAVALNAALIAIAFTLAGAVLVAIDRLMVR